MSVELKVGQVWKDREGREVTIAKKANNGGKESQYDLIELVQDENGWRPWKATAYSVCPVGGWTLIVYRLSNGVEDSAFAGEKIWSTACGFQIVAYKIIQEAPKAYEPPDDDGWIPYSGGGCPVAAGTQLEARFAGGNTHSGIAGDYYWGSADAGTLVAYRIVKEAQKATEPAVQGRTPRRHSHYFKDISQINEIDVYRVCELFGVDDPSGATQHAVKKLLCAGQRGAKDRAKDYQEAIDTLTRRVEMWAEGQQ